MTPTRPLLDEATTSFVQSGVSIIAASTDRRNLPTIVRVVGCRVSPDRRKVTLLAPSFEPFITAVRTTRTVAVTFSQPSTHKTIQLKATDAGLVKGVKRDAATIQAYADAFVADVCPLGYSEELIRALVWCDPSTVSAIGFQPTAAFQQTPGPRAGTPLTTTT